VNYNNYFIFHKMAFWFYFFSKQMIFMSLKRHVRCFLVPKSSHLLPLDVQLCLFLDNIACLDR